LFAIQSSIDETPKPATRHKNLRLHLNILNPLNRRRLPGNIFDKIPLTE